MHSCSTQSRCMQDSYLKQLKYKHRILKKTDIGQVPHLLNLILPSLQPLESAPQMHQLFPAMLFRSANCAGGISLPTALGICNCQHVRQKISLKAKGVTESCKHFEQKISMPSQYCVSKCGQHEGSCEFNILHYQEVAT